MSREEIQMVLKKQEAALRELGVSNLELFGSAARNAMAPSSDVDFLVEFDRPVGLFAIYDVQDFLQNLLHVEKVDLVLKRAVLDEFKSQILEEAIPCL